ncbi:hypothetical protein MHYP_G00097890 [Metynnis hypsauchen]
MLSYAIFSSSHMRHPLRSSWSFLSLLSHYLMSSGKAQDYISQHAQLPNQDGKDMMEDKREGTQEKRGWGSFACVIATAIAITNPQPSAASGNCRSGRKREA